MPRPNLVCRKYLAETHNADNVGAVAGIGSLEAQPLHNCIAVAATQRWRERTPGAPSSSATSPEVAFQHSGMVTALPPKADLGAVIIVLAIRN